MINVDELIESIAKFTTVKRSENYVIVTPPFYHIESDESIALKFSETAEGTPVITDCGTTKDYLELTYVSLENYREKLDAIKKRFFIEEAGGIFSMTIPTYDLQTALTYIGYFLQAISIIANIDL